MFLIKGIKVCLIAEFVFALLYINSLLSYGRSVSFMVFLSFVLFCHLVYLSYGLSVIWSICHIVFLSYGLSVIWPTVS